MSSDPTFIVRKGERKDVPQVLELIRELAVYEREPKAVTLTLEELEEDGFGSNPIYGLFVAETDENIIGTALYSEKYSTWKGRSIYLEDIIVTERFRGKGIGKKLFDKVVEVSKESSAARLEWQVLEWNRAAIGFYKR
jgi:GNAT superfamily N-acetyltransferase